MYRIVLLVSSTIALLALSGFRKGNPDFSCNPLVYNTTIANIFDPEARTAPWAAEYMEVADPDTVTRFHVLMLDYSSYGSAYNEKVRNIIGRYLPKTIFTDFVDGSADELSRAIAGCDAVVVAYPSIGKPGALKTYGKILNQFVQSGGGIIFTGTHEFEVLQQFGLFDLDFGYFSKEVPVHSISPEHPLLNGVSPEFSLSNFSYPLDISDPGFVTLADVSGYPTIGYKQIGSGKIVYLGIEYYYDEEPSSRILINSLNWTARRQLTENTAPSNISYADNNKLVRRSEEYLFTGTGGKSDQVDLKIYPNPYFNKANLDIELSKATSLKVEMTDEVGRSVALLLPKKNLGPGLCRIEIPNIAPGIYFLQVQIGDQTYVRKVVKASAN